MLCEQYKDTLIEAAATGAAPDGKLREHLAECAACRASFAEEQSLFGAIDSSLHAAANAEVPPSLLPRVRASLEEAAAPRRRWLQPLVFASASVVLALLVFLVARPPHGTPENGAKQGPVVAEPPVNSATNANPVRPSEDVQTVFAASRHSHAPRNSTKLHSAASSNLEVLVPPDEREAFARFLSRDHALAVQAPVSGTWAPKRPEESVEILPVEIASLTVAPLNKTDGTGQQTKF